MLLLLLLHNTLINNSLADMVRLLAEWSDTKSKVKLGGFRSQLQVSYMSSHTEELWCNETVCLRMTIYIYIYIHNKRKWNASKKSLLKSAYIYIYKSCMKSAYIYIYIYNKRKWNACKKICMKSASIKMHPNIHTHTHTYIYK